MDPWEYHPAIVHFPIALLVSAVALDMYAWARSKAALKPTVLGLLIAGVVTGVIAALSGVLAYNTVPAHTAEAHEQMYWHMWIQLTAMILFIALAVALWRDRPPFSWSWFRVVGILATAVLLYGSLLGGRMVFRGGAGVDPAILAPEIREGHDHGHGPSDDKEEKHHDAGKDAHDHEGH